MSGMPSSDAENAAALKEKILQQQITENQEMDQFFGDKLDFYGDKKDPKNDTLNSDADSSI